jgi:hypothetical protein
VISPEIHNGCSSVGWVSSVHAFDKREITSEQVQVTALAVQQSLQGKSLVGQQVHRDVFAFMV